MELTIARIGRAQGLRGELSLDLRTDDPQSRFARGAVLNTKPAEYGPLTVARTRTANGRFFVLFEEIADRTAAEGLTGVDLVIDVESSDEEDAWYLHELEGLRVELEDGTEIGKVVGLEYLPAQDALVIKEKNGTRTLLPFIERFVPVVDIAGGRIVVTPPGGLFSFDLDRLVISEETSGPASEAEGEN